MVSTVNTKLHINTRYTPRVFHQTKTLVRTRPPGGHYVLDHSMHDPKSRVKKDPYFHQIKTLARTGPPSPGGHYVLDHDMHDPKSRVKKDLYSDLS